MLLLIKWSLVTKQDYCANTDGEHLVCGPIFETRNCRLKLSISSISYLLFLLQILVITV